jgi:hypothetical protein
MCYLGLRGPLERDSNARPAEDPQRSPGVTPEQFSDYASAVSWFTAERDVLNASVSLAAGSDVWVSRLGSWP